MRWWIFWEIAWSNTIDPGVKKNKIVKKNNKI